MLISYLRITVVVCSFMAFPFITQVEILFVEGGHIFMTGLFLMLKILLNTRKIAKGSLKEPNYLV